MYRKTNPIFDSNSHGESSSRGDDYEVLHVSNTSGVRSPADLSGHVQRSAQGRQVTASLLVGNSLLLLSLHVVGCIVVHVSIMSGVRSPA